MCGIAGMVSCAGPLPTDVSAAIKPMTAALSHRGPDGDGFFRDRHAALGHRRLAIIDRAGGAQPMSNEDDSCWVVFNGEIYNHRALRHFLEQRGHRYRTVSDTETILHAYEEFGADCVNHLDGMFAFALYDSVRRELFLARDRVGKKPLFYAEFGDVFLFASEIKALYESPLWNGELNLEGFESYLSLGYFLAPETVYRHVKKLMPGHWLRVSKAGVETREYWDVPEFDTDQRDEGAILTDLEQLLGQAVEDRLESEVPLGAFLSGGIDSGLVVSFMQKHSLGRPVTTSVGFSDKAHDELEAAAMTAAHLGTLHYPHTIVPNLAQSLDPIVAAFDEPFADASAIPTFYVSKIARQHVTVALSGDGGDETFSGYDFRYVPHVLEDWARACVPGATARTALQHLGRMWPRSSRLPRALRLGTLIENVARDPADAYFSDLCFLKPHAARRLLGKTLASLEDSPAYGPVTSVYRRCGSRHPLQRAQYADLKVYLPNDPLVKVDRMSMLNSLEVRCPLLDRRVVEFAFRLPAHRKMPHLDAKHLLRTLAARHLPKGISKLPKRGFNAPVSRWIAGGYGNQLAEEVFSRDSTSSTLMDMRLLRKDFDDHRRGFGDHAYALWAVWMFEHWARTSEGVRTYATL